MMFSEPLVEARLVWRYKRFLADVEFACGSRATAHVAYPGAMLGLMTPGSRVLLSRSTNPARKLGWSWELVEAGPVDGSGPAQWIGVNTARPNVLVAEALAAGLLAPFTGYGRIRREVPYGRASRVDFLLENEGRPPCYLEVKNCHLLRTQGRAEFPDCVAARSAKHMDELAAMTAAGFRAALVYVVQMHADSFAVAADFDPAYAAASERAKAAGVEVYAYACRVSAREVVIDRPIPVVG